jgi:acyl-CoA synthetase (AMP-forming)/AMP-acid ligase II
VDLLLERAERCGERTLYTFLENGEDPSETVSYAEFRGRVLALAALLQERCAPRERVLLLYPSCIDYMVAFFACVCADLIAVPLFPPRGTKHGERVEAIVRDCTPSAVLYSTQRLAKKTALLEASQLAALQLICTDALELGAAGRWSRPHVVADTIAFLQYTSGSTGLPRGVRVSHGNLLHNERMQQSCFASGPGSVVVSWLPIYHDMGLIGTMLAAAWLGSQCVFMAPVAFLQRPSRWLRAISRFGAAVSGGPNFAFELCTEKIPEAERASLDLSSWKVAFCGAEPVRLATLERFAKSFEPAGFSADALHPCYGLAEGTLMVSGGSAGRALVQRQFDRLALQQRRMAADESGAGQTLVGCGGAVLDQTVRIVNEATREPCRPGEIGEIWVGGPSVAHGYWNRPELSAETFAARLAGTDEGPFLRTGDLGVLDGGELYITGRIKDVLIVRGANHYPQDLEATVEALGPALNPSGAAAFSIQTPDAERVVIVAEVARTSLRRVDVKALAGEIRRAVLEHHELLVSDVVLIRPSTLPKSSSGKVQRAQCRARYLAGELEAVTSGEDVATAAA